MRILGDSLTEVLGGPPAGTPTGAPTGRVPEQG
jgi:hypothetical protein